MTSCSCICSWIIPFTLSGHKFRRHLIREALNEQLTWNSSIAPAPDTNTTPHSALTIPTYLLNFSPLRMTAPDMICILHLSSSFTSLPLQASKSYEGKGLRLIYALLYPSHLEWSLGHNRYSITFWLLKRNKWMNGNLKRQMKMEVQENYFPLFLTICSQLLTILYNLHIATTHASVFKPFKSYGQGKNDHRFIKKKNWGWDK